jgi:hypothetical protein
MIGWMAWLGIANAGNLEFELSLGDASVEVVFQDLMDGEPRRVELGDLSASVELSGEDLRITVEDARGKLVSAPTVEVGSGELAHLTTPTSLGVLRLSAWLREERTPSEVRCEALRGPTPAELEQAVKRVKAAGGPVKVFAGIATVAEGGSNTTGAAMWVCAGLRP